MKGISWEMKGISWEMKVINWEMKGISWEIKGISWETKGISWQMKLLLINQYVNAWNFWENGKKSFLCDFLICRSILM